MTDKLIAIEGSVPVNKHKLVGPADPKQRIEVTVKLRRKSEQGLPTLDEFVAGKRERGYNSQATCRPIRRTARRCGRGKAMGRPARLDRFKH